MHPALAARIEASVRGRRRGAFALGPTTRRAIVRLSIGALLIAMLVLMTREQRGRNIALGQAKSALLANMEQAGHATTEETIGRFQAARKRLEREAKEYAGDYVSPSLETSEQVKALLGRPALYVRMPTERAADTARFERVVGESRLDAFLLCLKDPPPARNEGVLMKWVLAAYRGGEGFRNRAPETHRLYDAMIVARMLAPEVSEAVARAESLADVNELQHRWEAAKVAQRIEAVKPSLLVALLDEPKTPGTLVELDGASDHWVRVFLSDLSSGQLLVRWRHHLDPSWVSEERRPQYALGLEGCRLAYDFRQHLHSSIK